MNNYEKLNLYQHNIETCKKISDAFANGDNIVSIIKATGTGKSYIGLNLALEHKDEKIIWLVPTNAIKEHIEKIIHNNPNLSIKNDFPNLEIRTYTSLVNLSDKEIEDINCDLLIVDELHHIGAPVWGGKVNTLIYTHENIKTFGMSAYSVRDRGTSYERDMTNPDTEEIFSDTVVDRYDLYDAIIDGVLPFPIAKTVLTEKSVVIEELKDVLKLQKLTKKQIQHEIEVVLNTIIKTIHKQNPIEEIIQESIKEDGKYIYFCPVYSYEGVNDIESIKEQVVGYIKKKYPNKRVVTYQTTSDMGIRGEKNRDCFYHDLDLDGKDASDTIRIMFAKNQYNEGVHAPNIDGVFLGRKTESDIVALEQIGRALSVREDVNAKRLKYNSLDIEKLKELARNKKIVFEEDIEKEYLIELLLSPMIIDLTGNIEFLEELETNLKDRAKERRKVSETSIERLKFLENSQTFILEDKYKNILKGLLNLKTQVLQATWDDYYNLAKEYYLKYGHSDIPAKYITPNGVNLGSWCYTQRQKSDKLSEDRIKKLEQIEFRFDKKRNILPWEEWYKLALIYYNYYGNSEIPQNFKTKNGIDYDKDGVNIGLWCYTQRQKNDNLSEDRIKKLEQIEFRFRNKKNLLPWEEWYKLALAYYKHHGDSNIPSNFKTANGIDYDENGVTLGWWCDRQRKQYENNTLEEDELKKLEQIEFRYGKKFLSWEEWYKLALAYYKHYGNSEIPVRFKTANGIDYDKDGYTLGTWYQKQRARQNNLSEDRREKLEQIEFRFENKIKSLPWEEWYKLALIYYKHYGNSEIPQNFKTANGIDYDKDGYTLGTWCQKQRTKQNNLSEDRREKLEQIEFRFENKIKSLPWEEWYKLALIYYKHYGNSEIPLNFKTTNGIDYDKDGITLGSWCDRQRQRADTLSAEQLKLLSLICFRFLSKKENDEQKKLLCTTYSIDLNKYKILQLMSYQELYAKIMFLLENNISLEINGNLHEIFTICNENMILKYMISKEDLIMNYYINKKGKNV